MALKVIETDAILKHGCGSPSPSIVTMALYCIICEILVENRKIFIPHLHLAPPVRG